MNARLSRRALLQALGPIGASLLLAPPRLLASASPRCLILVELNGANDGLNTVVPYADPAYRALRPNLALAREGLLALDARLALHPQLRRLHRRFQARELAIVLGLGYPDPNRSHFRSIEIWDSGSDADQTSNEGWLTRLGSAPLRQAGYALDGVVIGRNPGPLSGEAFLPVVMEDRQSYLAEALRTDAPQALLARNPTLAHLVRVQSAIEGSADSLAADRPPLKTAFPKGRFGEDLAEAARLASGRPLAAVIKVALTGFDTHVGQLGRHQALLGELDEGLEALCTALRETGAWSHTLVMTYSEFGRRARENAARGTDHGTAAPHFVLGGAVRGGLYGEQPRLDRLVDDDLVHTVDFRRYYNSVLADWFGRPEIQFDPARHRRLDFLA
ncbi:MAG TPA: DUF1501 domain-containing protein [Nevskiaceae bacterium]|nr:DUF1501 domain-containing protein [Nevskiaceae bacterium]